MKISIETFRGNEERRRRALDAPAVKLTAKEMERADRALLGVVFLKNGEREEYVNIGRRGINWSLDAWSGHIHYSCLLNMFFTFLSPLAAAYAVRRDERYAAAARDYIEDWLAAHPEPPGRVTTAPNDAHELSLRLPTWSRALFDFLPSASFDQEFFERIIESLHFQADRLCDVYGGSDNKVVAMADALVILGVQFQQCAEAARWRKIGARGLNETFRRQFLPDGAHMERVPHYHEWMMNIMDRNWRLGCAYPDLGLAVSAESVSRMHDYDCAATRPNGEECALHDSHGKGSVKSPNAWKAGRRRFRQAAGLSDDLPPCNSFFPDAGQAFLRDSWEENALYLTFDATRNYPMHGHTHLSANSVQLHAAGRSLLVDAGYVSYDDPLRNYAISTRAHNTITVNGWDQCKSVPLSRALHAAGHDMVHGRYLGGYYPRPDSGDWVTRKSMGLWGCHDRFLLWSHGRFVLVVDTIQVGTRDEKTDAAIELNWQFCEGPVRVRDDSRSVITGFPDSNVLMLFPWWPEGVRLTTHSGETEPPRGWLPGSGLEMIPATQVCVSAPRVQTMNHFVTLMIPFEGPGAPEVEAEAVIVNDGLGECRLRRRDGSCDAVIWNPRLLAALGKYSSYDTDASLLVLRYAADGSVLEEIALDGTQK